MSRHKPVAPTLLGTWQEISRRALNDAPVLAAYVDEHGPRKLADIAWLNGLELTGPITSTITDTADSFTRNAVVMLHESRAVPVRRSRTLRLYRRGRQRLARWLRDLAYRVDARRPEPTDDDTVVSMTI